MSERGDLRQAEFDAKVDKTTTVNGQPLSGNVTVTKTDVGLGNVVNLDTSTTSNITDAVNKRFVTDAQSTVIGNTSGANTGDNATNTQYSGLAASKQDALISGTNIKTVNGTTLLGAGDLATGTVTAVSSATADATVANGTTTPAITIVSAPKLTTARNINGIAFDGTGNITVADATKEPTANKDATGGYVGLTLFKINFKNALNTFTSFFTNSNTAARTYTFQDRDGTIADDTDITAAKARANHTGTQLASTISDFNSAALAAAPAETTTTIGALINGATAKTSLVDADQIGVMDSAASNVLKKWSWVNIKANLEAYFDTLYPTGSGTSSGTNTGDQTSIVGITGTTAQFNTANTDGDFATLAGTETLTNKTMIATTNVVEEITTTASSATPTPTGGSLRNFFTVTALAAGATFAAPSGTPVNGNRLIVRIKDNGTARTLAYNAIYRAIGVTLPTTTVISKTLYLGCVYNSADSKWDVVAVGEEA